MRGCIYRTKDNECDRYSEGGKFHAFCDDNCDMAVPSNADRIRAMSDEELADWVAERCTAPNCTGKCHKDYEAYGELRTFCHDCWLDWLKQEAE